MVYRALTERQFIFVLVNGFNILGLRPIQKVKFLANLGYFFQSQSLAQAWEAEQHDW